MLWNSLRKLFGKERSSPAEARSELGSSRHEQIDLVGFDKRHDKVVLALVLNRPWEDDDQTLFVLQEKLNSYIGYVDQGRLVEDYPQMCGKKVEFRLQTAFPLRERDEAFIEEVCREHLTPRGIEWKTEVRQV